MQSLLQITTSGIVLLSVFGVIVIGGLVAFFIIFPIGVWWRALISNAPIPIAKPYSAIASVNSVLFAQLFLAETKSVKVLQKYKPVIETSSPI